MIGREYLVEFVKKISGVSKPRQIIIPYYLLDICGDDYDAAALLNQILFWMDITKHPQKWYARSYDDIRKELRLSKFRVMRAAKILETLGVETKSMISRYHKYARVVHWRMTDKAIETLLKKSIDDGILTSWSEETQLHDGLSNQETQLHEVEELNGVIDKSKEKKKEKKEKIISVASAPEIASSDSHKNPDIAPSAVSSASVTVHSLQGNTEKSATAEKASVSPAQAPSPSLMPKLSTAEDTNTPTHPLPLPAPADVKTVAAQTASVQATEKPARAESEKERVQRLKVEALVACGYPTPVSSKGWSNFKGVIKTLTEVGMTSEMYGEYHKWVKGLSSSQGGWPVTLNSLAEKNRPELYMEFRAKKAARGVSVTPQVSTTPSGSKNGYSRRNDPAYAHLYQDPETVRQAK